MERYTYIYGTTEADYYSPLGASAGLPDFLVRSGAVNPSTVVETIRNEISGIKALAGYDQQPKNDLPVAFRFMPFHLYKRPDMPKSMQPLYAVNVSGFENKRGKRESVYSQTTFLAQEQMHEAVVEKGTLNDVSFCYLDQIFGTRLLSYEEMNCHRDGSVIIDCDALPQIVDPRIREQDKKIVFNVVDAIYEDKAVVIRLENGYGFNKRSYELLLQIYSLLPPRLAVETGFAAYQEPNGMRELVANTSIRVFVLPAECEIKMEQMEGMLFFDLEKPEEIPVLKNKEMYVQLKKWSALTWPQRQVALEKLFADTILSYRDKEVFINRSQNFFGDPFFAWEREKTEGNLLWNLEEIEKMQLSFPLTQQIPWVMDRFKKKIRKMMKKGEVERLTAEALAVGLFGIQEEEKKRKQKQYNFGVKLGGSDIIKACKVSGNLVEKQIRSACDKELQHQKEMWQQDMAAEKARTEQAIADGKVAVEEEKRKAAIQATLAEEKLDRVNLQNAQEIEKLHSEHQSKIEEMSANFTTQYQELEQKAKADISGLEARHEEEMKEVLNQYTEKLQVEKKRLIHMAEEVKKKEQDFTEIQRQLADAESRISSMHDVNRSYEIELKKLRNKKSASGEEKLSEKHKILYLVAGFLAALLLSGIIFGVIALFGSEQGEPSEGQGSDESISSEVQVEESINSMSDHIIEDSAESSYSEGNSAE